MTRMSTPSSSRCVAKLWRKRMRPDPLGDVGRSRRLDDDPVQLPGADRLACMLAWKQPALGVHHALLPADLPPLAQQGEHIR